jgi:hypothetical protein
MRYCERLKGARNPVFSRTVLIASFPRNDTLFNACELMPGDGHAADLEGLGITLWRKLTSLPTISIPKNIALRLAATVISSEWGYANEDHYRNR